MGTSWWRAAGRDALIAMARGQRGSLASIVETTFRLIDALDAQAKVTNEQQKMIQELTEKMHGLNQWILGLTIVIGVLTLVQAWLALMATWPVIIEIMRLIRRLP